MSSFDDMLKLRMEAFEQRHGKRLERPLGAGHDGTIFDMHNYHFILHRIARPSIVLSSRLRRCKMKRIYASCLLATLAAATFSHAQQPVPATAPSSDPYFNPHPDRYLFEDKLKPGMKGYGLTVMRGGKIEKFDVEILDVMKNFTPGKNAILVKCTGLGLEESGIIAGMSGSPCYIDGKLIGAVAFGWGLAKEPIGGVQPIRQMLAINADAKKPADTQAAANTGSTRWSTDSALTRAALARPAWSALAKNLAARSGPAAQNSLASARAPQSLSTLATPLMVSAAAPDSLAYMQGLFAHTPLVPLQSGGAAGGDGLRLGGLGDTPDEKLKLAPGSAIAIPLLSGDMDISAIGTVTEVDGNKIWAFGHSMFADGPSQLPIATSYIYSILPSLGTSFKIGACLTPTGALAADENTGIVGFTGTVPKMIPVTLTLLNADGTSREVFHYQLVQHPQITPEILGSALEGTIIAQRNLPRQYTLEVKGTADFTGAKLPLRAISTSDHFDIADILLPIAAYTDNPFHNLPLEKIDLTATVQPQNKSADIRRIHLDRQVVAPGGALTVTIDYAPFQKPAQSQTLTVKVPADASEGDYDLIIGSADTMQKNDVETAPHIADPENIAGLISTVKQITSYAPDHLFARLVLDIDGAAVHGKVQRNLPASRIAILASDRQTGATPIIRTITTDAPAAGIFENANEVLHISIAKDANERYRETPVDLDPPSSPSHPSGNILNQKKHSSQPSPLE